MGEGVSNQASRSVGESVGEWDIWQDLWYEQKTWVHCHVIH